MKINSITKVIVMSAVTCFSTAALADVTPHSNTDSVDFSTEMTVQGKQCALEITPSSTNFSFTYTVEQTDIDNGTYGSMIADSGPSTVKVSVPDGCEIGGIAIGVRYVSGADKLAKNIAGIRTNNGGSFPFFIGISNLNFYTDEAGTTGQAYAINGAANYRSWSTGTLTTEPMQYGYVNTNSKYGSVNNGYPPMVASAPGGYMNSNVGTSGEVSGAFATNVITSGIYKIANPNDNPLEATTTKTTSNIWFPTTTPGEVVDPPLSGYRSAVIELAAVISQYPYSLADATPDAEAVYDTQSNSPITARSTLVVTSM